MEMIKQPHNGKQRAHEGPPRSTRPVCAYAVICTGGQACTATATSTSLCWLLSAANSRVTS
eukprot:45413-Eustigmatos_ZCMA.PRE.1